MAATVSTRGLRELNRDLGKVNKSAQKELQRELRAVAEPVAQDIRTLASDFGVRTVSGIAAGSSRGGAVVRQRRRRTTGHHPGFAGLLFNRAFLPGAVRNEALIVERVERMLDRLLASNGFRGGAT